MKVRQLLEHLEEIGEDVLITDGTRTIAQQNALYAQGRTKPGRIVTNASGNNSLHVHGVAIDIVPVGPLGIPLSKRYLLEWAALHRYKNIASIAKQLGFEWGGDWTSFPDKPHLQYTQGLTLAQFKSGRKLDLTRARNEWRSDLQKRLAKMDHAIASPAVTEERKAKLRTARRELQAKIDRI